MTTPRLVYDDDCGFCTRSAIYAARNSDVEAVPFSEVGDDLAKRLPENWRECAHLVVDGTVFSCGEAMERAYELTGRPPSRLLPYLRSLPGHDVALEAGYRFVADHRPFFSRVTRRLF
jgi:predicted DCC family thiol-disulfide oxidoreductase YuxK